MGNIMYIYGFAIYKMECYTLGFKGKVCIVYTRMDKEFLHLLLIPNHEASILYSLVVGLFSRIMSLICISNE